MSVNYPDPAVPSLTENAICVLNSRYLDRDETGITETPKQLFERVARHIASAEKNEKDRLRYAELFEDFMTSGRFMPNSPTLMNAGRKLGMLSACFVLPVPDDVPGIFKSVADTATIQKAGGGTGFAFDELRPCGSFVSTSGGMSSGPISFWRVFCESTNAIQQGAFRRGANMAMMSVTHPDIIKFLYAKQDLSQFTNYNISVKVTQAWVEAAVNKPDTPHVVTWENKRWLIPRKFADLCKDTVEAGKSGMGDPRALDVCYKTGDLIEITPNTPITDNMAPEALTCGEVLDIIIENAWSTGEPGLCFIDAVGAREALPDISPIRATNPCGEEPLPPNGSCNLGSINLSKYVKPFYGELDLSGSESMSDSFRHALVDWAALNRDVRLAVRFLDNVVEVNNYPTPEIEHTSRQERRIGLGIMGFADALIRLGVAYDSALGIQWGEKLMRFVNQTAINASRDLARNRGEFPLYEKSRWADGLHKEFDLTDDPAPMRNVCVTTVAPTGTISIIANCSGGVEPLFSFAFMRQVLNGERMLEIHEDFLAVAKAWGFYDEDLVNYCFKHGSIQDHPNIPRLAKQIFRSARDVTPEAHVKMQAAFQKHVTSAVSKTINLPNEATSFDVKEAYLLAAQSGCKGVTVYRDGCRDMQPMALESSQTRKEDGVEEVDAVPCLVEPVDLPLSLPSARVRYNSTYGSIHMHVSLETMPDGRLREREMFFSLGRSGDGVHCVIESFGRLASIILRLGGGMRVIFNQLRNHAAIAEKKKRGTSTSLSNELATAIAHYMDAVSSFRDDDGFLTQYPTLPPTKEEPTKSIPKPANKKVTAVSSSYVGKLTNENSDGMFYQTCPRHNCGGRMVFSEGCSICTECGEGPCN